jgi:hypothetical protein
LRVSAVIEALRMKVFLCCPSCTFEEADLFTVDLLPKNDCVYDIQCPNGHHFTANILYHEFQKLFEVAVNALADDYHREAVGSFAASYERFMELFIRIVMKANGTPDDELANAWKKISRQSERQLGAFVILFALEFGTQPPLLANAEIELRNKVIHQGYFPTKEECLKYGRAVLDAIRQTIRVLSDSKEHQVELIRSINDQGDFSSSGPNYHYFAWPLIGTNRPPSDDTNTLDEMLAYTLQLREHR